MEKKDSGEIITISLYLFLSIFCALGLISILATGGSDGGGSRSHVLSGTATKGIIKFGIVTAVELDADGGVMAEVGTAMTDEDGNYELELNSNYSGGVVRLSVTAGTTTEMICDAFGGWGSGVSFGDSVSLANDFSMEAVVQPEGGIVNVQITPFTHMAAAIALNADTLDASAVANAVSEVNQIVGVNILETEVVDITDSTSLAGASSDAKQMALFNAAMAEILFDDTSLQDNLDDLASSFSDGIFSSGDTITITQILDAVQDTLSEAGDSSVSEYLEEEITDVGTIITVIEEQIDGGVFDPEPAGAANGPKIDQAKALITSARTFVEQIASDSEDPLDALGLDIQVAGEVLSDDAVAANQLVGDLLDQVFMYFDMHETFNIVDELDDPKTGGYDIEIGEHGTVNVVFSENTVAMEISGELSGTTRTVDIGLNIATNFTSDQLTFNSETGLLEALTSVKSGKLTISGRIAVNGDEPEPLTSLVYNSVALEITLSEEVDLDWESEESDLISKLKAVNLTGSMDIEANGASFEGDVEINMVSLKNATAEQPPVSLQKISISGQFTGSDNSTLTAGASLTIDNAASFDTVGFFESADNFLQGNLTVSTTADITGLPEASIVISVDRNTFKGFEGSITVSHGGQSFKLEAESSDVDSDTASLTLTNPDGVKLIVDLVDAEIIDGTVSVSGTQIGTVSVVNGLVLVRYNDGTFETLY